MDCNSHYLTIFNHLTVDVMIVVIPCDSGYNAVTHAFLERLPAMSSAKRLILNASHTSKYNLDAENHEEKNNFTHLEDFSVYRAKVKVRHTI